MTVSQTRPAPIRRYNTTAMAFHWLVAALILINVAVGLLADRSDGDDARRLIDNHKSIGLTVLGLVILRILWRMANQPPPLPGAYSKAERFAAHAVHFLLYAVMLALPLTGYIHDSAWKAAAEHPIVLYGLVHFPRLAGIKTLDPLVKDQVHAIFGAIHVYLGYALYALVALHIGAAVKHQAFDGEPELERMLPAGYEPPESVGERKKQ